MIKVSKLKNELLDYWVGKADDQPVYLHDCLNGKACSVEDEGSWTNCTSYSPSTNYNQGCPIIDREGISVSFYETFWDGPSKPATSQYWGAYYWKPPMKDPIRVEGNSLLEAGLRCFVAMKLGLEVNG